SVDPQHHLRGFPILNIHLHCIGVVTAVMPSSHSESISARPCGHSQYRRRSAACLPTCPETAPPPPRRAPSQIRTRFRSQACQTATGKLRDSCLFFRGSVPTLWFRRLVSMILPADLVASLLAPAGEAHRRSSPSHPK